MLEGHARPSVGLEADLLQRTLVDPGRDELDDILGDTPIDPNHAGLGFWDLRKHVGRRCKGRKGLRLGIALVVTVSMTLLGHHRHGRHVLRSLPGRGRGTRERAGHLSPASSLGELSVVDDALLRWHARVVGVPFVFSLDLTHEGGNSLLLERVMDDSTVSNDAGVVSRLQWRVRSVSHAQGGLERYVHRMIQAKLSSRDVFYGFGEHRDNHDAQLSNLVCSLVLSMLA